MGDEELDSADAGVDFEIKLLARETNMPIAKVHALYSRERAKLEESARIKTFVPVIAHRRVKAILQSERSS